MANDTATDTPVPAQAATAQGATPKVDAQATPSTTPTEIQGTTVPANAPLSTSTTPDGKSVTSQELFRVGDVSISREQVTATKANTVADQFSDMVVINTGAANDTVNVSQRKDGTLDVDVNGQKYHVTLGPGQELAVRTGDGNDIVNTATNVTVNMDVRGGAGDDAITTGQGRDRVDGGLGNDTISTRGGRDDVFGNAGDDTIDAGDGHDVVYGGDGNDVLRGGKGRDYIEGGAGNDVLEGGTGNDVLSGGLGDDTIRGGKGNDAVYTGAGKDTVDNQSGNDRVYGQTADDTITAAKGAKNDVNNVDMTTQLGSSIVVNGSPEFQQRVAADIEMLRSSPNGRQMLTQLDAAAVNGNNVTISELANEHNGRASTFGNPFLSTVNGTVVPGTGNASTIEYNPSSHSDQFPSSSVTLYHELSHAYNYVTGTLQPGTHTGTGIDNGIDNRELQAVGLPNSGLNYTFPGGTTPSTANPAALTENGLRDEMGLPARPSYALPLNWNGGLGSATAMAPSTTGSSFASTGDAQLDKMLAAVQSGDSNGLRTATQELRSSAFGQEFQQAGIAAVDRQNVERIEPKQQTLPQPQVELQEPAVSRPRM
jgi:Effector protein/RTX calcium-binding nonapeptide repeat (4 copies)